jgi:hypothetical protein
VILGYGPVDQKPPEVFLVEAFDEVIRNCLLLGAVWTELHGSNESSPPWMQDKEKDVDTEGSGNDDDLDIPECARDEDYCPSLNQGHGSRDDSDDGQHCHKRRKASGSPYSSVRSTSTSVRDSRRRKRSTRAVAHSLRERGTPALGLLSRASSHTRSVPSDASAFLAQFQEWQLKNVSMKRISENGQTTFQVQFEWPLCANHPQAASMSPDSTRSVAVKKTAKRAPVRGAKYSDDEDNFLIQLKEEEQLRWVEIRRRFAQRFPERGGSGLQVHYCTKLKDRGRTQYHHALLDRGTEMDGMYLKKVKECCNTYCSFMPLVTCVHDCLELSAG